MKKYSFIVFSTIVVLLLLSISTVPAAQYWFQTGARGSNSANFNNGASVSIQTIYQNVSGGSFGFWTGEDLSNGAFVQIGYEISNVSGNFPQHCSPTGCSNYTFISAGVPTWFWEYFPSGYSGSNFYGGIGKNASAGKNGSFNTYSFSSNGNTWNFYFNKKLIGSVNLGTQDSGPNPPAAFAEYAKANTNTQYMHTVEFKNLEFLKNGKFKLVPEAYSYVGYGKASETTLPNLYGVAEVNNYVDYFKIGSDVKIPQKNTILWKLGYSLTVKSNYGNISGVENYSAYSKVRLRAPRIINISSTEREVFKSWKGTGNGSYTGRNPNTTIYMNGNITETALWQTQYYLNVSTRYGHTYGSGWYNKSSIANFYLEPNIIPISNGVRAVFKGWSTGSKKLNSSILISSPKNVSAQWTIQYLVNVSSRYSKVYGSGWYNKGQTAIIKIEDTNITIGPKARLSFEGWTNGAINSTLFVSVTKPLFVSAIFVPEYVVRFVPENAYGNPINVEYLNVDGITFKNQTFLKSNTTFSVEYAKYKGLQVISNHKFFVSSPETIYLKLPIYNVIIKATTVFGTPVNASVEVTFKNGSKQSFTLTQKGTKTLRNVPYGYVSAKLSYFGMSQTIVTNNGNNIVVTMFTPSLIAVILIGIFIIVLTGKIAAIKSSKKQNKK